MEHSWPGNVRELENVIERAVLLAKGNWITPHELPSVIAEQQEFPPGLSPEDGLSIKKASKQLERHLIQKALKITGGNRTQAAKILEISRPILIAKIKEYGLGEQRY